MVVFHNLQEVIFMSIFLVVGESKLDISPGNQNSFLDKGGIQVTEDVIQQLLGSKHLESAGDDFGWIRGSHGREFH